MSKSQRPEGAMVMVPREAIAQIVFERFSPNKDWKCWADCGVLGRPTYLEAADSILSMIAAIQQSPISGEGWQDISTAPKDGTRVIGFTKFGVEVVKWHEWDGAEYGSRTGWIGVEQDSTCYPESYLRAVATYQPTHWRPLPAPPVPSVLVGEGQGPNRKGDLPTETEGADVLVHPAVAHLWEYQEQLDADGIMVAVSRQALDETLQKHLGLIDVLTFCRESMIAHGDGHCGPLCEAMCEGPIFADEIASIDTVLVDQPRPNRAPEPTPLASDLAEALTWLLPLAKGYAAGRDVAANQRIIQNAEEILAAVAKGTTAHQIEMAVARTTLNRAEIIPAKDGLIAAWTEPGHSYPPYINLSAKGGDVIVIVRGDPSTEDGLTREGPTASMRLPRDALLEALTALNADSVGIPASCRDEPKQSTVSGEGGR